jgi:RNA polymerase sigma-70 factor (ECF subfamily)
VALQYERMSDEDLMRFIRGQEVRAFDCLVQRHHRRFYNMVYRWVLSKEDAEDVVQAAFLKLWTGKAKWKEEKNARFTTWFYRILYNQAMDCLRGSKRRFVDIEDSGLSEEAAQEEQMVLQEQQQLIRQALRELPERQRVAISMVYFEALPQKQIAGMMGISIKALESLLSRAKASLREWFETRQIQAGVMHYV